MQTVNPPEPPISVNVQPTLDDISRAIGRIEGRQIGFDAALSDIKPRLTRVEEKAQKALDKSYSNSKLIWGILTPIIGAIGFLLKQAVH